jgi:hypothetical protein
MLPHAVDDASDNGTKVSQGSHDGDDAREVAHNLHTDKEEQVAPVSLGDAVSHVMAA